MTRSARRFRIDSRVVLPAVLLAGTTAYLVAALGITTAYEEEGVGPSFFPIVIALVMCPALVLVLLDGLRAQRNTDPEPLRLKDPVKVVLLTGGYILLFRPLGYFLATTLYVYSLFFVFNFGAGSFVRRVLTAVVIALAFFLLFEAVFGVRLPKLFGPI